MHMQTAGSVPAQLPIRSAAVLWSEPAAALCGLDAEHRLALEQERHPSYLVLVDDCSPVPVSSLIPAACRH